MDPEEYFEPEPWYKGPIKYILGLFLIILLILWLLPGQAIKLDPEPTSIPTLAEVLPDDFKISNMTSTQIGEIALFVTPSDPFVKQLATKVSALGCTGNRVCHAKALYYFVRDNLHYVRDPISKEYIEDATRILDADGGDCESGSALLASLMESVGIDAQLVFITGHAYIRIRLPEAMRRYKLDGDWVYLDWTCSSCKFGEIPWKNVRKEARFLEVP